jgi:DNA-binding response OmpR family regulator
MTTILVVEDEPAIREGIADALAYSGYGVVLAIHGEEAIARAVATGIDLMLLDLMLPRVSGFEVLAATRRSRPGLPIIILTARGAEDDRVAGLRGGADDYVVKPFSARELLARIDALLRRSAERSATAVARITHPGCEIDLLRREIHLTGGARAELTDRETQLLSYLASHPDRAISRRELLERVWGIDARHLTTRTVDMHVARLREKLGMAGGLIETVRSQGYRIAGAQRA